MTSKDNKETIKKQLKLKYGYISAPVDPDKTTSPLPSVRHHKLYSSLSDFPAQTSPCRTLGHTRTLRSERSTREESEKDFLQLRKMIEMGEFQRPNKNLPLKSRRKLAQAKSDTPPQACSRPRVGRSRSTVRRLPDKFSLKQVKRISIADFRMSKIPGFISFACTRKDAPSDLVEKTRSIHCDLFGPGLCPDCQRLENRYDFTAAQEDLFPYLSVNSRSLVAAHKLKNQPTPYYVDGRWYKSEKREAGTKALALVYTEKDLRRRIARDNDEKKSVQVLVC